LIAFPGIAHAPVETMNCIADVRAQSATIHAPTQTPNEIQQKVAHLLGFEPAAVDVHVTLMGGGFGRRLRADYALEAAELSRAIAKPVQVLWTRTDDMRDGHLQHASVHGMRASHDAGGRVVAWHHKKASNPVMTGRAFSEGDLKDLPRGSAWGSYDVPYAIPHVDVRYVRVDSPIRYGPWRAVFAPSSVFARESFFDEVAHAARRDRSSCGWSYWPAQASRPGLSRSTARASAAHSRPYVTAPAGARRCPRDMRGGWP
jgi:CO/xanthine dehydrogenase Mo-binding subunit